MTASKGCILGNLKPDPILKMQHCARRCQCCGGGVQNKRPHFNVMVPAPLGRTSPIWEPRLRPCLDIVLLALLGSQQEPVLKRDSGPRTGGHFH